MPLLNGRLGSGEDPTVFNQWFNFAINAKPPKLKDSLLSSNFRK